MAKRTIAAVQNVGFAGRLDVQKAKKVKPITIEENRAEQEQKRLSLVKKGASAEEKRARLEKCTLLNPPRQVIVKRKEDPKAEPLVVGEVVGEVSIISGDADYKHVLHRIRQTEEASSDGSQYAYRLGYWTFTGDGRSVKWGQYHAILSEKEWADLMRQARDKGWGI